MIRAYYSDVIANFLKTTVDVILGQLVQNNDFALEQTQRDAWVEEIRMLQNILGPYNGSIYFEYSIPRMGRRIDTLLLIGSVIFVLEFKVGEREFPLYAIDQVWDYALDLKNFHETSHDNFVAPVLIATKAQSVQRPDPKTPHNDRLLLPMRSNTESLGQVIDQVLRFAHGEEIDSTQWESGRYQPTPTIIEAATALYNHHSVKDILSNSAEKFNLSRTTSAISNIIQISKENAQKSICFVTGVPGAGKTLVGLDIATQNFDQDNELYSVFLSGNEPLVTVLREALTRDSVARERELGRKVKKGKAKSIVKAFIQNVHHFRDECLVDPNKPPIEHVALFDEAQRAWNFEQTTKFMRQKKHKPDFNQSEPEFLISCLDRHSDWAVIVCLVGGGQEIYVGEAGIGEWIESLNRSFQDWHIYISSQLTDSEYSAEKASDKIKARTNVTCQGS